MSASALLTPKEVGQLLRVTAQTVTRWAREGKLAYTTTFGGHRRYYRAEVELIVEKGRNGRKGGDT